MTEFGKKSVHGFLDEVAARQPAPGGGAVAAAAGALSVALARMVAAYSANTKITSDAALLVERVARALQRADSLLRALIEQDAQAFEQLQAVQRRCKEGSATQGDVQRALWEAIAVPTQIAALAVASLQEMDALKVAASRFLLTDLGVAAVIAQATAHAARYSVRINLNDLTDAAKRVLARREIDALVSSAKERCESVEQFVVAFLERDHEVDR